MRWSAYTGTLLACRPGRLAIGLKPRSLRRETRAAPLAKAALLALVGNGALATRRWCPTSLAGTAESLLASPFALAMALGKAIAVNHWGLE